MIYANIKGQIINLSSDYVVSDSVKYLEIEFTFSEDWNGTTKTAVFTNNSLDNPISLLLSTTSDYYIKDNIWIVPFEVIKSPNFYITVYGIDGDKLITADKKVIPVIQSGYVDGIEPSAPTEEIYQQLLNSIKPPYIGTNGYWYAIDDNTGEYYNTNVKAQGEKGDTGATGPQGIQGIQGEKGDMGFSPTATVSKVNDTATITITDVNGTTTAQITDGVTPTIDQTYSATSENAQSGVAVAEALQNQYINTLTTPATVTDSNGGILLNEVIAGNSTQDGTPTPTAPIAIQHTGNTLTLKSGISADDTNATIYTIPLTDINGTSHIMRKFDEVKKHDDGKWHFESKSDVKEFDGTENFVLWSYQSTVLGFYLPDVPTGFLMIAKSMYSNRFKYSATYPSARDDSVYCTQSTIYFGSDNWSTPEAFKEQLAAWNTAGDPLTVLYQKATTTSYELSASTSAILDNIAIQKGNANIYFTNTVVPTMTTDYFQDLQLYCKSLEARIEALENIQ